MFLFSTLTLNSTHNQVTSTITQLLKAIMFYLYCGFLKIEVVKPNTILHSKTGSDVNREWALLNFRIIATL